MEPAVTPIIEVQGLTAAYGEESILDNLSFTVGRGEVFVILGGSGCGKSTLLKHLIGLYRPAKGNIFIDGEDLVSSFGESRQALLRKIGVMYQNGALFGSMTLLENLCLPLEEFTELPETARNLIATMNLSLVGLADYHHYYPAEISGGMRKRAAIARAMVLGPQILFLDEPSAGLDPITSAEMDELILRLAGSLGMTIVVVSHELPSIRAIADRVIMLDKETKGISARGTPQQLAHSTIPQVRQFFARQAGN
ncbi:polyamine ABC transporter ATP-binding protein [Syntrophotalea acetylenivorans]|uniref:Polyamine ABC transporter ATP-binding protein n=1 Tax=Syntrophotalea acetylenivorans TaxID=1842532 RepID=A0A1L3GQ23_9BACT|nr:ATP-binding cassette domain-containing protein [Syntrophotalea acetylenivorans]APG28051.1 polyamine ABC transporter ATP-binding protein [Syntrophotalea acetylenivorans]